MPDDPLLPPAGDLPPTPKPRERLVCEHCECQLAPNGDVLKVSDKARGHLRAGERIAALEKEKGDLETELRDVRAKLAEFSTVRESKKIDLQF